MFGFFLPVRFLHQLNRIAFIFAGMIDLRSDTVTKPSPAMLEAMMQAAVGDDVFEEDPSINELEKKAAEMFGMEASIFCPTGTMTNQAAIKCHTQPGDEVICDKLSHIYQYEGGGVAFNAGCSVKLIDGDHGRITAAQVEESINNRNDVHKPNSKLVSLENTANRGGGTCYDFEEIQSIKKICETNDLRLHLDGARLFNAIVAKKESPKDYGKIFDSISICISKGLGAPVGSILISTKNFVAKARRVRKVFGGGMRQAGYLAAACLYALENNIERLNEDHIHAKQLADALSKKDFVEEMLPAETNIVIFKVKENYSAAALADAFKQKNILVIAITKTQIRMVTHLDISKAMINETIQVINHL